MSRLTLITLVTLFLAAPFAMHAQGLPPGYGYMAQTGNTPPYNPPRSPWLPAITPSPRYPLAVSLQTQRTRYDGVAFIASGRGRLLNTGQDLTFSYRCDITFPSDRSEDFEARWITPGRKFEILLQQPGTHHLRTCRISTRPPIQSTQP